MNKQSVKVEVGVKDGKRFLNVFVDGREESLSDATAKLTGTNRTYPGIFAGWGELCPERVWFERGEFRTYFEPTKNPEDFPYIDWLSDTGDEIVTALKTRIHAVRDWLSELDFVQTIFFTV